MPLALEWRFAAIEVPNGGSFKSAQTQKGALATMYDPPFPPVGFFQPWFFYMIFDMSDAQAMFNVLRQSADADVVAAIERLVRDAPDHRLCRINVVDFATKSGLNEERIIADVTLDSVELPPGEKAILSLQLPAEFVIVFEPVTHAAQFLDIKGEATRERQNLSLVFNKVRAPTGTLELRPGPFRLAFENRTDARVLPGVWIAGDALHGLLGRRKPFL